MSSQSYFPYPFPIDYFMSVLEAVGGEISAVNFFKWLSSQFIIDDTLKQIDGKHPKWQKDVFNVAKQLAEQHKITWKNTGNDIIWTTVKQQQQINQQNININNNRVNNNSNVLINNNMHHPQQQQHRQYVSQQQSQPHHQPHMQQSPQQRVASIQHHNQISQQQPPPHQQHQQQLQQTSQRYASNIVNNNYVQPPPPHQQPAAPVQAYRNVHPPAQSQQPQRYQQQAPPPIPQQSLQAAYHSPSPQPYVPRQSSALQQPYSIPTQPSPSRIPVIPPHTNNQIVAQSVMHNAPRSSPQSTQQQRSIPPPTQQPYAAPIQHNRTLPPQPQPHIQTQPQQQQLIQSQPHRHTPVQQAQQSIPSQPAPIPQSVQPIDQKRIDQWKVLILKNLHNNGGAMLVNQLTQRVLQGFPNDQSTRSQFSAAVKHLVQSGNLLVDKLANGDTKITLTNNNIQQHKSTVISNTTEQVREQQRAALKQSMIPQQLVSADKLMDIHYLKYIERTLLALIQLISSLYDNKLTINDNDKISIANQITHHLQLFDQTTDLMIIYLIEQINKYKSIQEQHFESNQFDYSSQLMSQLEHMKQIRHSLTKQFELAVPQNDRPAEYETHESMKQSDVSDTLIDNAQSILQSPQQIPIPLNTTTDRNNMSSTVADSLQSSRDSTPLQFDNSEQSLNLIGSTPQTSPDINSSTMNSVTQSPEISMFDSAMSTARNNNSNSATSSVMINDVSTTPNTNNMVTPSPQVHVEYTPDILHRSYSGQSPNVSAAKLHHSMDSTNNINNTTIDDLINDSTTQDSNSNMDIDKFSTFYQSMSDENNTNDDNTIAHQQSSGPECIDIKQEHTDTNSVVSSTV